MAEEEGEQEQARRIPCEVYSRVVGYLRPVSAWNLGRQQEWADRVPYKVAGQRVADER